MNFINQDPLPVKERERDMKFLERPKAFKCLTMASLFMIVGCGGVPTTPTSGNSAQTGNGGGSVYPNPYPTFNPPPTPTPTPTPTQTPTPPGPGPLRFGFQIRGTRGGPSGYTSNVPQQQTFSSIYTDTTLRITVTANQTGAVLDTGYSYSSDCFMFSVRLNNLASQTVLVKAGSPDGSGYCNGVGNAYPTADFSSQLPHGSTAPVSLTISQAQSTTCGPNGYYPAGCYSLLQNLYATYVSSGNMSVVVDGVR